MHIIQHDYNKKEDYRFVKISVRTYICVKGHPTKHPVTSTVGQACKPTSVFSLIV